MQTLVADNSHCCKAELDGFDTAMNNYGAGPKPQIERAAKSIMQRANDLYLFRELSRLGSDALLDAAGLRPLQEAGSRVHVSALRQPGIHPAGVVHLTSGPVKISLFAKVQKADYNGAQSLERELHFLSNVAPLIAAENPGLRSPLPVAYYPERRLLLMEFVPGDSLKHHLFSINFGSNRVSTVALAELLRCAGRWLGSFHRLTLQGGAGNPLEWLLQEFGNKRTMEAFLFYSQKNSYDEMLSILTRCLDLNPEFRRNLCNVHGEFTPIHVMVASDAIYVVDFGNSRLGYPYEDVGLFAGFYDCLPPWRIAAGSMRIQLQKQKQLFLSGYFEQRAAFNAGDRAMMRWVRLISFARMLNAGQDRSSGWGKWAYSRLTSRILRKRFAALCNAELAALRGVHPDIFNEESFVEQGAGFSACGSPAGSRTFRNR